ncbi:MAG: glycosyltransferase family 39 protein, partial [Gammaproteobacteria bacterium]|nr:glycosyltransferase family 39 protein [Gammaproteobacteria bacterium]
PIMAGRDFSSFIVYYNQFWDTNPVWHTAMLYRTPITPLFIGGLYKLGGGLLLEVVLGLCFVASVLATYYLGTLFSRFIAIVAAITVAMFPTYGVMFHLLTSDNLFATFFILWAAFISHTARTPRLHHFVWHGVAVFMLVLVRPSAQTFLIFCLFPFLMSEWDTRKKLSATVIFLGAALALLFSWASYNYIRYDDFTVARGGAAQVPFYRVFVFDRLVQADNGPASRTLARAIESELLDKEPYRTYAPDADVVLQSGDTRVWSDLAGMSDRVWGWDSDFKILRQVALEAIGRHPWQYLKGVLYSSMYTFSEVVKPRAPTVGLYKRQRLAEEDETFVVDSGHIIPKSYQHWLASNPEGSIRRRVERDMFDTDWYLPPDKIDLPPRDGSELLVKILNKFVTNVYPPMYVFLVLGAIGVMLSANRFKWVLLFIGGMALLQVILTQVSVTLNIYYRTPFDPIFMLLGIAGFIREGFRNTAH